MGLLQKKQVVESAQPLYSLSTQKSVLIVGLGNPGSQYGQTRHNVGFKVLDEFAKLNDFPGWSDKNDLHCSLTIHNLDTTRVILCKPSTFMNDSGRAVQAVQYFYKLSNAQTLVTYDELAIDFGQIRTRVGGSDGGHNGVKSIISHVGEDFGRLRIGIGPAKHDAAKYVLGRFSVEEKKQLPEIVKESSVIISEYIFGGTLPNETRSL